MDCFFGNRNRTTISQLFCISLEFLETLLAIRLRIGTNTTHTTLRLEQRLGSCWGKHNQKRKKCGEVGRALTNNCHLPTQPTPFFFLFSSATTARIEHCVERAKHYSFLLSNPTICESIRMIMVGEGTHYNKISNHLQAKRPAWLLAIFFSFFLTESALAKSFEGKAGFTDILSVQILLD